MIPQKPSDPNDKTHEPEAGDSPPAKEERKRILIVDDHPMMRAGLTQLISRQPSMEVCGEAGGSAEAMEQIAKFQPDLIIADLTMKGGGGLEFIKDARTLHANIPILVVSMHDENVYAERSLRAGAAGYIMKEESPTHLVSAIQRVLDGGIYLSETMSGRILKSVTGTNTRNADSPLQKLTDREFEIFQLIGRGSTTEEIAAQLHISRRTVDVHRSQIKEKLHIKSGTALVHYAVQWLGNES
jgi:DNA-binding NarL/FixJ family response regulator